jgi:nucleoside-diphosphate-sugar epimerase
MLTGLDTGYFANQLSNGDILPENRVDLQYFQDVRNLSPAVLSGVDVVVSLAAISNDPMGKEFEAVTYDVNYRATIDLAQKARAAGAGAFIFASSCSVYGFAEDSARHEGSPLDPQTAYARSKVLAEKELAQLAGRHFMVTCLRFSTACGMAERLRLDLVLNDFVAGAVSTGKITILSDGTPLRPLINVKDMARAVDWAVGRDPSAGGNCLVVNVGRDDWNYRVKELAEAVARVIPGVELSINKGAPPDRRSYRVDFGLFKALAPEHQPRYDLLPTIEELKLGLEAMRFSDPDFRNSNFIRLKVLRSLRKKGLLDEQLHWTDQC